MNEDRSPHTNDARDVGNDSTSVGPVGQGVRRVAYALGTVGDEGIDAALDVIMKARLYRELTEHS